MAKKVVPQEKIPHVSVDYGREDLNNQAQTINRIIDIINGEGNGESA